MLPKNREFCFNSEVLLFKENLLNGSLKKNVKTDSGIRILEDFIKNSLQSDQYTNYYYFKYKAHQNLRLQARNFFQNTAGLRTVFFHYRQVCLSSDNELLRVGKKNTLGPAAGFESLHLIIKQ